MFPPTGRGPRSEHRPSRQQHLVGLLPQTSGVPDAHDFSFAQDRAGHRPVCGRHPADGGGTGLHPGAVDQFPESSSGASLSVGDKRTVDLHTDHVEKPTVVLVHGAFADASGLERRHHALLAEGYPVYAPPNPLRGLTTDAEYLASVPVDHRGPDRPGRSLLRRRRHHQRGDRQPRTSKALVYVAAYALDEGENVAAANELGGGHSDLLDHIVVRPFPGAPEGDGDVYVDPASLPLHLRPGPAPSQTAAMAAGQRPGTFGALVTPSGVPAWETIPSWYLPAGEDQLIPPAAQAAMAERAGLDPHHPQLPRRDDGPPVATASIIIRAVHAPPDLTPVEEMSTL